MPSPLPSVPENDTAATGISHTLNSPSGLLFRLSSGHFLADTYAGFMLPLLPLLSHKLGFSLGAAGLLLTCSSFSSSIIQPLFGLVSDRVRGINFALWGVMVAALFISLIGWSNSYISLMFLIFMGYIGVGLFHPQATTYTHCLEPHKKNWVMGIFISIGTLGFATGPFLSSFLVERGGLNATVWAILPGLLGILILRGIDGHFQTAVTELYASHEKNFRLSRLEWYILSLLCVIGICRAVILVGLPAFLPFIWSQEGYTLGVMGMVIGLSSIAGCPSGILGGYLGDRWGERTVLLISFLPCLVLLPWIFQTDGWLSFAMFILVIALLEASLATSLVVALRGVKKNPNTVSGLVGGFSWGVAGLLMPLIGMLGDAWGIENALMLFLIPITVAVIAIMLLPMKQLSLQIHEVSVSAR